MVTSHYVSSTGHVSLYKLRYIVVVVVSISCLTGKCAAQKLKKPFEVLVYGHVYIIMTNYGHIKKTK